MGNNLNIGNNLCKTYVDNEEELVPLQGRILVGEQSSE